LHPPKCLQLAHVCDIIADVVGLLTMQAVGAGILGTTTTVFACGLLISLAAVIVRKVAAFRGVV